MKKFIACMTVVFITTLSAVSVYASTGIIQNGTTFVPIRGAFEELGFDVEWDSKTKNIYMTRDDITITVPTIKATKAQFYVGKSGVSHKVYDRSELIKIDDSYYIPLRDIVEKIGAEISWDAEEKVAHISYNGKDSYVHCVPYEAPEPETKTSNNTSNETVYPDTNIPTLESYAGMCTRRDGYVQGKNFAYDYVYAGSLEDMSNAVLKEYEPALNKIGFTQNPTLTSQYTDSLLIQGNTYSGRANGFFGIGLVYTNSKGSKIYIAINSNGAALFNYVA
jgi:hypothetical protein